MSGRAAHFQTPLATVRFGLVSEGRGYLIWVGGAWEERLPVEHLAEDAADRPHIHGRVIGQVGRQQQLGAAVPARHHVLRHGDGRLVHVAVVPHVHAVGAQGGRVAPPTATHVLVEPRQAEVADPNLENPRENGGARISDRIGVGQGTMVLEGRRLGAFSRRAPRTLGL